MQRFAPAPPPASSRPQGRDFSGIWLVWSDLVRERCAFDARIVDLAKRLDPSWLEETLTWLSGAAKREVTAPVALLVIHFFNHQTHHRGQVHCLLTQAGASPPDTDLMLMK